MITIDGSFGEGGGQILRSSLALSLITGKPFAIKNIRAGRKKPGLMRQHLTALNAAAEIGDAEISGNKIGSQFFTFKPGSITAGDYHFAVGTAGSATLVFQTILPALLMVKGESTVVIEGGTHNPFTPPYEFLESAFLGVVNQMGPSVKTRLERFGFYPAGGGRFTAKITPSPLKKLTLTDGGDIVSRNAKAIVSHIPLSIAHRELKGIKAALGWEDPDLMAVEIKNSNGPGNIITLTICREHVTEVFTGFGERGTRAERVAKNVVKEAKAYLSTGVPVGPYLADQLMIPFAMAGGKEFHTHHFTRHAFTNKEIIETFLEVSIQLMQLDENRWSFLMGAGT